MKAHAHKSNIPRIENAMVKTSSAIDIPTRADQYDGVVEQIPFINDFASLVWET